MWWWTRASFTRHPLVLHLWRAAPHLCLSRRSVLALARPMERVYNLVLSSPAPVRLATLETTAKPVLTDIMELELIVLPMHLALRQVDVLFAGITERVTTRLAQSTALVTTGMPH